MLLSENQIKEKLLELTNWEYKDGQIQKTYSFKNFETAIKLVNQIAMIAENLNHHPNIDVRYSKVTFILSTHSESGVTEKDFNLAREIEKTAAVI